MLLEQRPSQFTDVTQIPEGHDTPDDVFFAIFQQRCRGADRDPFLVGTNNIDGSVDYRGTGIQGFAENTIAFANIAAEDFETGAADGFLYGDAGNFFRCAIKVGDAPVQINRVHPVRDVVQYDLILIVKAFVG